MKILLKKIAIVVALFAFGISIAHAGFVSLTNTSGNEWNIEFSPITLTVKSSPGSTDLDWLVFEDFFATNSTGKGNQVGPQSISIAINSGLASSFNVNNNIGIHPGLYGVDANDLFINIAQDNASASAGDTITVFQDGTGVKFSTSGVVPALNSSWNGQVAFWANSGPMVTENTFISAGLNTIPEPATLAILGLGLAGIGFSRRKAK